MIYRPLHAACKHLKPCIAGFNAIAMQYPKVLLKAAAEMAGVVKTALLRNL